MSPLALCAALLLAPPTLGDGLRSVGAFEPTVDHSLDAPPPPPRTVAKVLLAAGGALIVAGIAGAILSPGCATRDAAGRCVDPRGAASAYPALIFFGLGAAVTGAYWYRQEVEPVGGDWEER